MTTITYEVSGNEFYIESKGHAGYADAGSDIVCAAISTLVQTLYMRLQECGNKFEIKIDSGYFWMHGTENMEAFNTIMAGLKMVESSYPQYISISKGGCPIFCGNPLE